MDSDRLKYLKEVIDLDYTDRHDMPQLYFTIDDLKFLITQVSVQQKEIEFLNNRHEWLREAISVCNEDKISPRELASLLNTSVPFAK